MMNKRNSLYSDYGSASSSYSSSPWGSVDKDNWQSLSVSQLQSCLQQMSLDEAAPRAQSFGSVGSVKNKRTLEDVMLDFQMNGSDSPYDPDDNTWGMPTGKIGRFAGMGPPSGYLRQKSWPEPEASPATPLPWPRERQDMEWEYGTHWTEDYTLKEAITAEQMRVLQTLPNVVLYELLRDLQAGRQGKMAVSMKGKRGYEECRFCKNNGERESYFRSHFLKDQSGRVRCPVLRAFVCKRCGATGDHAHTIKYCPLSTDEERVQSTAMMRSVRLACGRKRISSFTPSVGAPGNDYNATPSTGGVMWNAKPLEPVWAALEQKLMQ